MFPLGCGVLQPSDAEDPLRFAAPFEDLGKHDIGELVAGLQITSLLTPIVIPRFAPQSLPHDTDTGAQDKGVEGCDGRHQDDRARVSWPVGFIQKEGEITVWPSETLHNGDACSCQHWYNSDTSD